VGVARILLVDDDPALLCALPEALTRRLPGCVIETADSAERALTLLQGDGFDLVISDLVMSGSGGAALVSALEELRPSIPTIVITGLPKMPDLQFETLAVRILHKPFDVCDLVGIVRELLEKQVNPQ
jgi:two-component system response regulator GlrR